jgi:hypothetical protein
MPSLLLEGAERRSTLLFSFGSGQGLAVMRAFGPK